MKFNIIFILFFLINIDSFQIKYLKIPNTLNIYKNNYLDHNLFNDINKNIEKETIKQITSILPKIDTIGHNILKNNNEFVYKILNNDFLDIKIQKIIILTSIHIAQIGDNFGSFILSNYYYIVEKLL